MSDDLIDKPLSFAEHKETTAKDIDTVAAMLTNLAAQIREGDLMAFERFWIEGGTEEGDAKIEAINEMLRLRYHVRQERVTKSDALRKEAIPIDN